MISAFILERVHSDEVGESRPEKYMPGVGDLVSRLNGTIGIVLNIDSGGYVEVFTHGRALEKCYGPNLYPAKGASLLSMTMATYFYCALDRVHVYEFRWSVHSAQNKYSVVAELNEVIIF